MRTRLLPDIPSPYHDLLTLAQVAAQVGRSERTVWRWVRDGQLHGIRLGGRWFVSEPSLLAALDATASDHASGAAGEVAPKRLERAPRRPTEKAALGRGHAHGR